MHRSDETESTHSVQVPKFHPDLDNLGEWWPKKNSFNLE